MMWGWMCLAPLLVIGLIAVLLGWRPQRVDRRWEVREEAPLEVLRKRYARGEISREEYEEMRRDLEE